MEEGDRNLAVKVVAVQAERSEVVEAGKLCRNRPRQAVVDDPQDAEAGEVCDKRGERAGELALVEDEAGDAVVAPVAADAGEVADVDVDGLIPVGEDAERVLGDGSAEAEQSGLVEGEGVARLGVVAGAVGEDSVLEENEQHCVYE